MVRHIWLLSEESRAVRLRAERRAGQLLKEMEKAKGGHPYQGDRTAAGMAAVGRDRPKTLKELGVSERQSWRECYDAGWEYYRLVYRWQRAGIKHPKSRGGGERLLGAEYKATALMEAALNPGFPTHSNAEVKCLFCGPGDTCST